MFQYFVINDLSSKKTLHSIIVSKYESVIRDITMKNKLTISRHGYEIMTKTVEILEYIVISIILLVFRL